MDISPPMLERARERFKTDERVMVCQWDMAEPIESFGSFDVILSGFAIHHHEDERKRTLFAEVSRQLHTDGLFANLDVVASATPEFHSDFLQAIGRTADDAEDRLTDVETQLRWMREVGMNQVGCLWRWRGFALLIGSRSLPRVAVS